MFPRLIVTSKTITKIVKSEKNQIYIALYLSFKKATARIPPFRAPSKNPTEKNARITSASFWVNQNIKGYWVSFRYKKKKIVSNIAKG